MTGSPSITTSSNEDSKPSDSNASLGDVAVTKALPSSAPVTPTIPTSMIGMSMHSPSITRRHTSPRMGRRPYVSSPLAASGNPSSSSSPHLPVFQFPIPRRPSLGAHRPPQIMTSPLHPFASSTAPFVVPHPGTAGLAQNSSAHGAPFLFETNFDSSKHPKIIFGSSSSQRRSPRSSLSIPVRPFHRRHLSDPLVHPPILPSRLRSSKSHEFKRRKLNMDPQNQNLFDDENIEAFFAGDAELKQSSNLSGLVGIPSETLSASAQAEAGGLKSGNTSSVPALFFEPLDDAFKVSSSNMTSNSANQPLFPSDSFDHFNVFRDQPKSADDDVLSELLSPVIPFSNGVSSNAPSQTNSPAVGFGNPQQFLSVPSAKPMRHPILNQFEEMHMIDPSTANIIQFPSPFIPFIPSPLSSPLVTFSQGSSFGNSIPGQSLNDMTSFLNMNNILNGLSSTPQSLDELLSEQGLGLDGSAEPSSQTITSPPSQFPGTSDSILSPKDTSPRSSLNVPSQGLARRRSNDSLAMDASSSVIRHGRSLSFTGIPHSTISAASGSSSNSRGPFKARTAQQSEPHPLLKAMLGMEGVHETVPEGKFWKTVKGAGSKTLYQCPFPGCEKTFTRPYNLKSHYRQHTGERPFVCELCSSAFARKHDLKRHQNLHQGLKPHICPSCKKGFARGDALKRHLKPTDAGKESACALKLKLIESVARQHLARVLSSQDTTSASASLESLLDPNLGIKLHITSEDDSSASSSSAESINTNPAAFLQEMIESIQRLQQGAYDDELVQRMLGGEFDDLLAIAEKDI